MPVLALVLAIAAALVLWMRWRAQSDALGRPRNSIRPGGGRARRPASLPRSLEAARRDPRLAAAGVLSALCRMDGAPTKAQLDAVRVECRAQFRVPQPEADEIAAYGAWVAEQAGDPETAVGGLAELVRLGAPVEAQKSLLEMMGRIARVDPKGGVRKPTRAHVQAIDAARRALAAS